MKHIFFAFPAGSAGVALLLFRLSAAVWIAGAGGQMAIYDTRIKVLALLASASLLAGFPTRAIALACAIAATVVAATARIYPPACAGAFVLSMLALTLIGPGAYSVDAALFGRRTVHLPE